MFALLLGNFARAVAAQVARCHSAYEILNSMKTCEILKKYQAFIGNSFEIIGNIGNIKDFRYFKQFG